MLLHLQVTAQWKEKIQVEDALSALLEHLQAEGED